MINLKKWKDYLESTDYCKKTKDSYYEALVAFSKSYKTMNAKNFKAFKTEIIETYAVQTVNLRILALNKYCKFIGHPEWTLKGLKGNKRTFLDNVITQADYSYLCKMLKKDDLELYFLVRFIGCTGARKSEALKFKAEDVKLGYMDIIGKGGKLRRIYIPKSLQKEALNYKDSGLLFDMPYNKLLKKLKEYAIKYKLDPKVIHPHSFRHFFALSFIEKFQDLALLADLLGHSNIETTRIYLRRTSAQQASIVNKVVTW